MSTTVDVPRVPPTAQRLAPEATAGVVENWSALAVLMAGTFVIVLDFFIVNVAMPSMQSELHATATATLDFITARTESWLSCCNSCRPETPSRSPGSH